MPDKIIRFGTKETLFVEYKGPAWVVKLVLVILAFLLVAIGIRIGRATAATNRADDLAAALRRSAPSMTAAAAGEHVAAALAAETSRAPAEVLLAMSWVESRYIATAVSRLECIGGECRRRSGDWPSAFPRRFAAPYFCGYLQAKATSELGCRAIGADLAASYTAAATHLDAWDRFCRGDREARAAARGDLLGCALAGYNGGIAAARTGRRQYANAVRGRARRLADGWLVPSTVDV